MIQTIGLIVAVYAIGRMFQIPFEPAGPVGGKRWVYLTAVSAVTGLAVFFLASLLTGSREEADPLARPKAGRTDPPKPQAPGGGRQRPVPEEY